ncbi:ribosome-inactivating family protein [Streptomyces sp. NPDC001652]|uniref:ribosome-inactivating family protein n=1 Tax=Streptomyces sp. NPDC001652 TaxID=3154393 RepID=UPI0033312A91
MAGAALITGVSISPHGATPSAGAHNVQLDTRHAQTVQDQTPVFWSTGTRWDYWGFLNNIRRAQNAYNNNVPGTTDIVDHTDPASAAFFDVMVGGRRNSVRIRLRSSDLYLVGWFTRNDTYNYIGPANQAGIPATHTQPAHTGQRGGNWQLTNEPSYGRLEGMARGGFTRASLRFSGPAVDAAVANLYRADHSELMAQSVLFFTQFISEAVRFRPIADTIGWQGFTNDARDGTPLSTQLDPRLIGQENQWSSLSERFNWMLAHGEDDDPRYAYNAVIRRLSGEVVGTRLITLAQYALVLNMAHGYPGRP